MHSPVTYSPPCHSLSIHLSTPSLPKVYLFHHSPPCLTSIPFSNPSLCSVCTQPLKPFFSSLPFIPPLRPSPPSHTSIYASISSSIPHFYLSFISYVISRNPTDTFLVPNAAVFCSVSLNSHSRPKQLGKRKPQHCHLWAKIFITLGLPATHPEPACKKIVT
jgi:hypothetical protein